MVISVAVGQLLPQHERFASRACGDKLAQFRREAWQSATELQKLITDGLGAADLTNFFVAEAKAIGSLVPR
jgi:hypothetical protein